VLQLGNFFQELKRRNAFRPAAAYALVAWLLIQVVDVVGIKGGETK